MDWLRSEDLKGEKMVTTPSPLYHVEGALLDSNYVDGRTRESWGYGELAKASLAEVIKEMAKPRVASSARENSHVTQF
jgi:hypothetical protein